MTGSSQKTSTNTQFPESKSNKNKENKNINVIDYIGDDIDFNNLCKLSSANVDNLKLVNPGPSGKQFKKKCNITMDQYKGVLPTSSSSSDTLKSNSHLKKCPACKRNFKGKRGLLIHRNKSNKCKINVPQTSSTPDENFTIPDIVANTVKGPSTSVESLNKNCGNENDTKIKIHKAQSCNLCHTICRKDKFVSSSTHRIHSAVIPHNVTSLNCNSNNLIYLITCRKCHLQYVGETSQPLRERISSHVHHFNHPNIPHSSRILAGHFNTGHCKGATFSVNIIEKLNGDGREKNGKLDPSVTRNRRNKETNWMLKLRTVYPYGLNDRIGDEYMRDRNHDNVFAKFPPLMRIKEGLKIRTRNKTSDRFVLDRFIYIINESLRTNIKNTMNLIRVLLSSLKRSHCRILFDTITSFLSEKHDTYKFSHYFLAALDIVKSKIGNPPKPITKSKTPPTNICRVPFNNKAIDFINIHKILKDNDVCSALPEALRDDIPTVVYTLTNTIRSRIFNYKEFVQSLDVDRFLRDETILPCDCLHSPYIDMNHEHILTGDLNIVDNINLRNLISKGPKYREPQHFSYDKAKDNIALGIENCIDAWSTKKDIPVVTFQNWKNIIMDKINARIQHLTHTRKFKRSNIKHSLFNDHDVKTCLSELQNKYVMVPIDKAANNVAFVCKRFYAHVLLKELGIAQNEPSSTYSSITTLTNQDVISQHKHTLKEKFNLSIEDNMLHLPDIYWMPKLHKNPTKFRFIIASKRCTYKSLSKDISSIFTLLQKQVETYHNKAHFYSGVKTNWIVHNRDSVLTAVDKSVQRKSAKCLASFDFSTLYTKIPHDKLIYVLTKIVEFTFKGGTRKIITVNNSGIAKWSNNKSKFLRNYSKDSIIDAISFLINNCFFNLGGKLFRQIIGIPMGSDPAPAFANLFLFYYESSWLNDTKKSNNILARKFGLVFRYIDDLLALNDGGSFERNHHNIYPTELQLNKENIDNNNTTFLDLHISIDNKVFKTKLFDKRDNFGFHITRLPYKSSNIPNRMFYTTISTECLRICRSTSELAPAVNSIKSLVSRMVKQGAEINKLKNCVRRSFNKHLIHTKYNTTNQDILTRIFG